jgi:hypothetical protein
MFVLPGCALVSVGDQPIRAEQVGPVFVRPGGDGPPIECRGLDRDHCVGPGSIEDRIPGVDFDEIERVIVSCLGRCTSAGGEFPIDILVNGRAQDIGRGAYGDSQ